MLDSLRRELEGRGCVVIGSLVYTPKGVTYGLWYNTVTQHYEFWQPCKCVEEAVIHSLPRVHSTKERFKFEAEVTQALR